jgi:acetolactate synthase-1/2/3 large subunit
MPSLISSSQRGLNSSLHYRVTTYSLCSTPFHQQNGIPLILTRHEQATVFMADGYARSCGEPGVAMVTKGPGRCNAFTAIVNAFTDCVPLVVIFGHSSRKQLAKGMLQEVPYLDTFQTVAKWTFSIPSPERVPEVFRRAFTLARSGRPGPVIIEIPQDISMAQADIPPYTKTRRVRFGPDPYDIDKLLELMRDSKRPLLTWDAERSGQARQRILSGLPKRSRCQ